MELGKAAKLFDRCIVMVYDRETARQALVERMGVDMLDMLLKEDCVGAGRLSAA
jgi:hypothetical protein